MDPATIVGTTSAILSFIQFSGTVISVAYKIRDSSDGAIDDNRNLEEAVAEFQTRLEGLRPTCETSCSPGPQVEASAVMGDPKKSLLRTARECDILGSKVLDVLNKTKAHVIQANEKQSTTFMTRARKRFRKEPLGHLGESAGKPTLVEGIRASFQTVWQKDKLEALRRQWEGCVIRLNSDLQRLEGNEKHDMICAAFQKNAQQVGKIRDLLEQSQIPKLEYLQSFLEDFNQVDTLPRLEQRNVECILRALEFEGMNARREQVEDTVGHTFEWFLTDGAVPWGHPELKIPFKKWLSDGHGVYHVTGKPGSGKSTLMKLIDKATELTKEQLESWTSKTGERLIMARFYTWKAANAHPLQTKRRA